MGRGWGKSGSTCLQNGVCCVRPEATIVKASFLPFAPSLIFIHSRDLFCILGHLFWFLPDFFFFFCSFGCSLFAQWLFIRFQGVQLSKLKRQRQIVQWLCKRCSFLRRCLQLESFQIKGCRTLADSFPFLSADRKSVLVG